jgi:GTP-binding protein LepA
MSEKKIPLEEDDFQSQSFVPEEKIFNIIILAHIDHGKTSLTDSLISACGRTINRDRHLDNLSTEMLRGITIKSQAIRLYWRCCTLNIIDTPGHRDFKFEAERAIDSCGTALLLIDSSKGIESETLEKFKKARDAGLFIIPVITKIDLVTADVEGVLEEMLEHGIDIEYTVYVSAKSNLGINDLLNQIIGEGRLEQPNKDETEVVVLDSWYDSYRGVYALVKVLAGKLSKNKIIFNFKNKQPLMISGVGYFAPDEVLCSELEVGQIGFVNLTAKNITAARVGDILLGKVDQNPKYAKPIAGPKPMLFATLYQEDSKQVTATLRALAKYALNDPAFKYEQMVSDLHPVSFLCGFLGALHQEVVLERILAEHNITLGSSLPQVAYRVTYQDGTRKIIHNPSQWQNIKISEEPFAKVKISLLREGYIGTVMQVCKEYLGENIAISENGNDITCMMPLAMIISGLDNKLLSICSGYSSLSYEVLEFRESKLSKLEVKINGILISDFSLIVPQEYQEKRARYFADTLAEVIPRSQIKTKIQVCEGSKVIASSSISAHRKDVTDKCYGGDQSRKDKLLRNQKKGKKRMENTLSNRKIKIPKVAYKKLWTLS